MAFPIQKISIVDDGTTALADAWKSSTNADHETPGIVSWKQLEQLGGNPAHTEFIFRTNATQNAVPTVTEFPDPINEDAAIVVLNDGRKEYYVYASNAWTQRGSVAAAVADGRNFLASRTNATANVPPTNTEVPSPKSGDTAAIYLNNGNIEQWFHNGTAWSLIYTVNPSTLDGNTVFVARTTATTGAAPTNAEVVAPVNGDTAIVFLSNGLREYWTYGTTWTLIKTEGNNRSEFIFRTNATQNVVPTVTEFPTPVNNDATIVVLSDRRSEYYVYVSSAWVQRGAISGSVSGSSDGQNYLVARTNSSVNIAPTIVEVASPKAGDTAIVFLTNGIKEYWAYTTAWALAKTDGTLSPTSQHDFGVPVPIAISPISGVQAHLEGGAGYAIAASTLPDNWAGTLLNTTSAARTSTFSGFAGAFLRDGTGTALISPFSIPANSEYRLESVVNGPNRWLNVIPQGGGSTSTLPSSAISFNKDVSLLCNNVWTARNIGVIGTAADFDSSGVHYVAKRTMVLDISVTCMSSEGGGITVGLNVQIFRNNTWVDLYSTTSVTNPSAGVVPFHRSAQVAINAANGELLRFLTNSNDGGGNSYPGDRVFRIAITESPTLTLMPANTTVLTPRNITGSITSTGYDGVTVPYQIPLTAGQVLNTVSLNGTQITDFDANTGIVRITPSGANIAVTHTTRAGATFNSPQIVSRQTGLSTNFTSTATSFDFGTVLQEGDEIIISGDYGNDAVQSSQFYCPSVRAGASVRLSSWPATDTLLTLVFPATLTQSVSITHGSGNSSFRMRSFVVRRDAANKVVIPTATTLFTERTITVNPGNYTFICRDEDWRFIKLPGLAATDQISALTATAGADVELQSAVGGWFAVRPHGANPTITVTTGVIGADFIRVMGNKTLTGTSVAVGALAVDNATDSVTVNIPTAGIWSFGVGCSAWDDDQSGNLGVLVDLIGIDGTTVMDSDMVGIGGNHLNNNWQSIGVCTLRANLPAAGNYIVRASDPGASAEGQGVSISSLTAERSIFLPSVVPNGFRLAATYSITVNGGANGTFTGNEGVGPQPFTLTNIPANQKIDAFPTIAGVSLINRQFGLITIDRAVGAGNLAITGITFLTWQRTLTEASGALINGAATQNIDATAPYSSAIAVPSGQFLQSLTATNATIGKFTETGAFTINPTNAGNVVLTATFAMASATDFIHVVATTGQTTGLSVGSPVLFSTPTIQNSAGCTFANGIFTLPANKTFRLESQITSGSGTELIVQWRNITNNTLIGGASDHYVGGRGTVASAIISTTQVTTVRLEILYNNNVSSIDPGGYSRGAWAFIKEIDRVVFSAPPGTTLATPVTVTVNGGTNGTFTALEGVGAFTFTVTGIPAGNIIDAFPNNIPGVALKDARTGEFIVQRASAAGNINIPGVTFRASPIMTEWGLPNGNTQWLASVPRVHPISGLAFSSLAFTVGDRRNSILSRESTFTVTLAELQDSTQGTESASLSKTVTYTDTATATFTLSHRYAKVLRSTCDIRLWMDDSHGNATNTYSDVRRAIAIYA